MTQLILHHYPNSPFAEKIRTILGYKKLEWHSVLIPTVMPKPDLTALSGGYRRTPVLQIGADIYCDTAMICQVLEEFCPQPSLYPVETRGIAETLAQWADSTLFWTAVTYVFQPAGAQAILGQMPPEQAKVFRDDRAAFRGNAPSLSLAEATAALQLYLQRFENMLAAGQPFLLGDAPCIADFSCYHPLWFVQAVPALSGILDGYPSVLAWLARMRAIGHHQSHKMPSDEAIAIALASEAKEISPVSTGTVEGINIGSKVVISASDYGTDPVEGELIGVGANQLALKRTDERAGELVVHFPRIGFRIKKLEV